MSVIEIISLFVFPVSLASFQLAVEQEKTILADRIGMFRNEVVTTIIMFSGFIFMTASGIIIFIHSWVLLICIFFGTAVAYVFGGREVLIWLWYNLIKLLVGRIGKQNNSGE